MILIAKDNNILEVTKGSFENMYKHMGFKVVEPNKTEETVEDEVVAESQVVDNATPENLEGEENADEQNVDVVKADESKESIEPATSNENESQDKKNKKVADGKQ